MQAPSDPRQQGYAATSRLSRQDMMEAVSEGVRLAIWQMITNATDMPSTDFFQAITNGVAQAHRDEIERQR